ncbi:pirin family protein [Ancylobacter terrae]|uniref:pirin family protein n=1 Tax=Ancylobacter sp. sgz301288 TaxID=3342077 RepID=UPI00385B2606
MLDMVIDARKGDLGNGFEVRRILPFRRRRMVGPFIFMDHAGPVNLPPDQLRSADVRPHPHIGLSTVSYLFNGQITHRDSLGVEQVIRPGEVNWMTAGRGISHSERFEDPSALAGGALEMMQTWVALPETDEESAPSFDNYQPAELPVFTEGGVWLRLIAGSAYGLSNAVKTHSPLFYLHAVLQPGARLGPPRGHAERAAYVAKGRIEVGGRDYGAGQMLVFGAADDPVMVAREASTVMLLGGEPLGERFIWWNFVSSRKERIEQAKADWKAGRIALPPGDDHEFIPLPEERLRPPSAEPLS